MGDYAMKELVPTKN